MNFAQMLATSVTPLSSYDTPKQTPASRKLSSGQTDFAHASQFRHRQAFLRFAQVMRDSWVTTRELEKRLSYAPGSIGKTLQYWLSLNLIERKEHVVTPGEKWSRKKGYAWRIPPSASLSSSQEKKI